MIASLLEIFAEVLKAVFEANSDAEAEEEALMAAAAKLAALSARKKFGP